MYMRRSPPGFMVSRPSSRPATICECGRVGIIESHLLFPTVSVWPGFCTLSIFFRFSCGPSAPLGLQEVFLGVFKYSAVLCWRGWTEGAGCCRAGRSSCRGRGGLKAGGPGHLQRTHRAQQAPLNGPSYGTLRLKRLYVTGLRNRVSPTVPFLKRPGASDRPNGPNDKYGPRHMPQAPHKQEPSASPYAREHIFLK